MSKNYIRIFAFLLPVTFSGHSSATNEPSASIVMLRSTCSIVTGSPPIDNCFTSTDEVVNWLDNTRNQDAGPLSIEIGPGQFGAFKCNSHDNLSLKGSGPTITILRAIGFIGGIEGSNCFNFNVQDLTAEGTLYSARWVGAGSSTWSNVHLLPNSLEHPFLKKENTYGWSETCQPTTKENRAIHRWVSSRIVTSGKTAYLAACSENWFFGTQLVASGSGNIDGIRGITVAAFASDDITSPEAHFYGGNIQVIADASVSFGAVSATGDGKGIIATVVGKRGELHIHGTGIDVIGNDNNNDIAALGVADGGFIHASVSAYVMKTGSEGTSYRILNEGGNSGTVRAPYTWDENVLTLPDAPTIVSDNGKDTVVENVCINPECSETRPHVMVYTNQCNGAGGTWFDTTANTCRQ